jgi:hypothetical protein
MSKLERGTFALALLSLTAGSATAADWSINPRITASFEYNDNTRLTEVDENTTDVTGAALDASAEFLGESPRGLFRLLPRARSTFYPGDESEETDSQYVLMELRRINERSEFELRTDYSRIETLGGYLPNKDPDDSIGNPDPGQPTGGRTPELNRQDRLFVNPNVHAWLSERHGIELGAGYVDVSFDQQVAGDREDFKYAFATVGYLHRISPTKTLSVSVQGAQFERADGDTTDSQNAALEWTNTISETSQVFLRAGTNRSENDDQSGWSTGFSGGVGVRWSFEVTSLLVDINSDLDPNAAGKLVQRDQARFQLTRRLSPVTSLRFASRLIQDSGTADDDEFEERRYATTSIGYAWRFRRQWTLEGAYTYVWRDFENDSGSAEANRVSIGITYEPNRR